jgi:hypothetical protein
MVKRLTGCFGNFNETKEEKELTDLFENGEIDENEYYKRKQCLNCSVPEKKRDDVCRQCYINS